MAAWQELFDETDGELVVAWNNRTLTPASIRGWQPTTDAASPLDAFEAIRAQHPNVFSVLYGITAADELLLFEEQRSRPDYAEAGESGWEHSKLVYHREHKGFRVLGDTLSVHFLRAPGAKTWTLSGITSQWVASLPAPATNVPAEIDASAEAAADKHFADLGKAANAKADEEFLYVTRGMDPGFVKRVVVTADEGAYAVFVEPLTAEVRQSWRCSTTTRTRPT